MTRLGYFFRYRTIDFLKKITRRQRAFVWQWRVGALNPVYKAFFLEKWSCRGPGLLLAIALLSAQLYFDGEFMPQAYLPIALTALYILTYVIKAARMREWYGEVDETANADLRRWAKENEYTRRVIKEWMTIAGAVSPRAYAVIKALHAKVMSRPKPVSVPIFLWKKLSVQDYAAEWVVRKEYNLACFMLPEFEAQASRDARVAIYEFKRERCEALKVLALSVCKPIKGEKPTSKERTRAIEVLEAVAKGDTSVFDKMRSLLG